MLNILILAAALDMPPIPPGYTPKTVTLSPKATELKASLGTPMVKAAVIAPMAVPVGFVITNLSLSSGNVLLQWQRGVPLFQVQASALDGNWQNKGGLTAAHSKTFPVSAQHFFRISQSNSLPLNLNPTNQPRVNWTQPEIDMSDSIANFHVYRTADAAISQTEPPGLWTDISGALAGTATSFPDGTTPNPTLYYTVRGTTANGVTIPYVGQSLSGVASGTATMIRQIVAASNGEVYPSSTVIDSAGNILVGGFWRAGSAAFGDGNSYNIAGIQDGFLAKYSPTGTLTWLRLFNIPGGKVLSVYLCVGPDDSVTVAGTYQGSNNDANKLTERIIGGISLDGGHNQLSYALAVRYTSSGSLAWVKQYNPSSQNGFFSAVMTDSQNTYLGLAFESASDPGTGTSGLYTFNFQLVKISVAGVQTVIVNGGADYQGGAGRFNMITLGRDSSGNLVLVGNLGSITDLGGYTTSGGGMFVAKYNSATGAFVWPSKALVYPGPAVVSMALESSDTIVLSGIFTGSYDIGGGSGNKIASGHDSNNLDQGTFIVGYSTSGTWLWQRAFKATVAQAGGFAVMMSVAVAPGKIYTCGSPGDSGGSYLFGTLESLVNPGNYYVLSMNSHSPAEPTFNWVRQIQPGPGSAGSGFKLQTGQSLGASSAGPVLVGSGATGTVFLQPQSPNITMSTTWLDGFVVKYTP